MYNLYSDSLSLIEGKWKYVHLDIDVHLCKAHLCWINDFS